VGTVLTFVVVALIAVGIVWLIRQRSVKQARELDDARFEARRWVERLGGQIYILEGNNDASKQALADASERHNAAAAQLDRLRSPAQARQITESAYEGLYYVRAARAAMGLDLGPELPPLPGQQRAGAVSEAREIEFDGQHYSTSPEPSQRNQHYFPGGTVAGRPVPQGWYSEPWWRPALVAGAWGVGSALLFSSMFSGMSGVAYADGFADGAAYGNGPDDGTADDGSGDADANGGGDNGGDTGGDFGGDFGGGDFGGGDFGGGDF
jgi:uncharacterized membrane protein YgcG